MNAESMMMMMMMVRPSIGDGAVYIYRWYSYGFPARWTDGSEASLRTYNCAIGFRACLKAMARMDGWMIATYPFHFSSSFPPFPSSFPPFPSFHSSYPFPFLPFLLPLSFPSLPLDSILVPLFLPSFPPASINVNVNGNVTVNVMSHPNINRPRLLFLSLFLSHTNSHPLLVCAWLFR